MISTNVAYNYSTSITKITDRYKILYKSRYLYVHMENNIKVYYDNYTSNNLT
jgi:hypothetical protein